MSGPYVLLQFGDDPFTANFEDLEARAAFTISQASESPTLVMRLTREAVWSQHHPSVMGPDNSFFYFGPGASPGYIAYGNNRTSIPMGHYIRQKRDGSPSRYFTAQSGKDYKWRISPQRMECLDGRTTLAVWELSQPEDDFHARLTIKHSGIALVTEILTTLILNRMSHALNW